MAARTAILQSIDGPARVRMAAELTEDADRICRAGIAARHPDYGPADVTHAFLRIVLGDELFVRVHPGTPLIDP